MADDLRRLPTTTPLSPEQQDCDQWFFDRAVKELCKRTRHKADLSEDEVLVLALAAGQAALARYVVPGGRDADDTLNTILSLLDHQTVVKAVEDKARELLAKRQGRTRDELALSDVLEALYQSEINAKVCLSSFWDDGWHWNLSLGDELNGVDAQRSFRHDEFPGKAVRWLIETAIEHYPASHFAKYYAPTLLSERRKEAPTRRGDQGT